MVFLYFSSLGRTMVKIQLVNFQGVDETFFTVNIVAGQAPQCFVEGTASVPNAQGGFDIFVDPNEQLALQKAGRIVGGLGLNKVRVVVNESFALNTLTATQFVVGMYSEVLERQGFAVAFDLNEAELSSVERNVKFITLARIFANSPNNLYHTVDLLEQYYAALKQAFEESKAPGTLSFELYKKGDQLFDEQCIGLQAVGNSSAHEPCLGVIDYVGPNADQDKVDITLVGKGIAFDTGGYDLKPSKFMETMRTDKTGLITVAAALGLAGAMGADKHLRCYLPCCENMVSGTAMVPGDILHYPNGVSVEIANTDAEGRLILADALLLACKDQPKYLLDAATLTGAAKIAIGRDMTAALTRNNKLDEQLEQAYNYTGEEIWLLPLKDYHKRYITAKRADIANSASQEGSPGASTAAAFLSFFVKSNQAWTHLDLSNAYMTGGSPYLAVGSTGSNVLSLAHWMVAAHY